MQGSPCVLQNVLADFDDTCSIKMFTGSDDYQV
jgi:hypothetical protein